MRSVEVRGFSKQANGAKLGSPWVPRSRYRVATLVKDLQLVRLISLIWLKVSTHVWRIVLLTSSSAEGNNHLVGAKKFQLVSTGNLAEVNGIEPGFPVFFVQF